MRAPANAVPAPPAPRSGVPARYRRVLALVLAGGAALLARSVLDGPGAADDGRAPPAARRALKNHNRHVFRREQAKKKRKRAEEKGQAKEEAKERQANEEAQESAQRAAEEAAAWAQEEAAAWAQEDAKMRQLKEEAQRGASPEAAALTRQMKEENVPAQEEAQERRLKEEERDERALVRKALQAFVPAMTADERALVDRTLARPVFSETTREFLPVMTKDAFGAAVSTFRAALRCFRESGLHLVPTGGTLVGTLRHRGMIPWDNNVNVYYFWQDREKIFDKDGPVQACLKEDGIRLVDYRTGRAPTRSARTNIHFITKGKRRLAAYPAHRDRGHVAFVSRGFWRRRSTMRAADVFPLEKYPFHDYHVYLPRNITRYLAADWARNQVDGVKTPTLESLMSTAVAGHFREGCRGRHGTPRVANITDIEYLQYYRPEDPLNSLPFSTTDRCRGRTV